MTNLQSSVNKMGKEVIQIFHFSNGNKRTFAVLPETIKDGSFCKMDMPNGGYLLVNPNNVDCIEVFKK